MAKKAIIVGATSGIGRELVKVLSINGYIVGATGRRLNLLKDLKEELTAQIFIKEIDVTKQSALSELQSLIDEMDGVDLIVISAGTGSLEPNLPWNKEKETIETNVLGFGAIANIAYHHFIKKNSGHLVGISSIASIRGGEAPAYNASKAFVANYLQGLRYLVKKNNKNITITDIQPGFVDTAMAQGEGLFWVATPEKAVDQIFTAIKKKKNHAYITKRWRLIAWVLKILPDFIYNKL
ncbi:MAG TPA: SDR family NAD(P)-dependent oxidoreductase [Leucothrix sp.]|nr:SDR family NAD(P)-dependent oxidoreductase [Leucothrix sp.]